ncbi:MAG: hypothetical protein KME16_22210 [Scytolyngbya sp. HA4215-MV1]|jgi:hypothetical protein|nr:hypothetical protein [Scytolyngbya sp. HA4215-MV1]
MKRYRKRRFSDFFEQPIQQQSRYLRNIFLVGLLAMSGLPSTLPKLYAEEPIVIAQLGNQQPQATAAARIDQLEKQIRQIRASNFDLSRFPVTPVNEKHWRNILWTTAVVAPQEAFVADTITRIVGMTEHSGLSQPQMRTIDAAMQVGTQLYLSDPALYANIGQQFFQTIERSPDPEWVAMALSGLAKSGLSPEEVGRLSVRVRQRFPKWDQNIYLYTTLREAANLLKPAAVPPLTDLLNWTIAPQQIHLYVICQPDRGVLCRAVLKDRQGNFARQNGQLWSMPLLLRSIHGLNWNFVRGQTPQGIYRMEGVVSQPDNEFFRAYGQFPLVNLYVPLEPGAREFLPGKPGGFRGNLSSYQALLPTSWRNYFPLQQSYWAGRIGRSLFRIHGSGEAPDFFKGKERFPQDSYNWNPTIGCLSALELYDQTGTLQQADMPKLLNALRMLGGNQFSGYLVVVEIPGEPGLPISMAQIEAAVAGKRVATRNQTSKTSQE